MLGVAVVLFAVAISARLSPATDQLATDDWLIAASPVPVVEPLADQVATPSSAVDVEPSTSDGQPFRLDLSGIDLSDIDLSDVGFGDASDSTATTTTATTTTTKAQPKIEVSATPPAKADAAVQPTAKAPTTPAVAPPPPAIDLSPPVGGTMTWSGIGDAADPFVVATGDRYLAFTTNTGAGHVPVWESGDASTWTLVHDALPALPGWAAESSTQTWAPAVLRRGAAWVLYFTSREEASGLQCVGAAEASKPEGPYVADGSPLVCQRDLGGSIDASPFVDPAGVAWLLYKNDGNCCGVLTSLWSQRLSESGRALEGNAHQLLWAEQSWEGSVIEGPSMTLLNGRYHLLYSANSWNSNRYAIGHAVCTAVTGPCFKTSAQPWQQSDGGPGGAEFFQDSAGNRWIALHEWRYAIGYPDGVRSLYLRPLRFGSSAPSTAVPTTAPPETAPPKTVVPLTTVPTEKEPAEQPSTTIVLTPDALASTTTSLAP